MEEAELQLCIQKMETGDKEAFRRWYREYKDYIYRTVYLLVNHRDDTDDVVSEIYIAVFRSLHQYDPSKPFIKWLNGIIVTQTSNWNRKLWRKFRLYTKTQAQLPQLNIAAGTEQQIVQQETDIELMQIIGQLPFKLKSVLILRYYQDYSFQEVSDVLGIPLGTAKSRHHQAIAKLRTHTHVWEKINIRYHEKGESL